MVRQRRVVIEQVIQVIVAIWLVRKVHGIADDSSRCSLVACTLYKVSLQPQSIAHPPQHGGDAPENRLFYIGARMGFKRPHQGLVLQKAQVTVVGEKIVASVDSALATDSIDRLLYALDKARHVAQPKKCCAQMILHG